MSRKHTCLNALLLFLASFVLAVPAAAGAENPPPRSAGVSHLSLPTYREANPLLLQPAEPSRHSRQRKLWWISLAAMGAGSALDAASSWNRRELNPVLRSGSGHFGHRGAMIKLGLTGVIAFVEGMTARNNPEMYRTFTVTNFSFAAGYSALALRNSRLQ